MLLASANAASNAFSCPAFTSRCANSRIIRSSLPYNAAVDPERAFLRAIGLNGLFGDYLSLELSNATTSPSFAPSGHRTARSGLIDPEKMDAASSFAAWYVGCSLNIA